MDVASENPRSEVSDSKLKEQDDEEVGMTTG